MDRERAFVEYGRILKEAEDWIARGYRGEAFDEAAVRPPRASGTASLPGGRDAAAPASGRIPPAAHPAVEAPAVSAPPEDRADAAALAEPAVTAVPLAPAERVGGAVPAGVSGGGAAPSGPDGSTPAAPDAANAEDSAELRGIADEVRSCRGCNLFLIRENTVPGVGLSGATLMIVTPPPTESAGEEDGPLAPYEAEYLGKWLVALGLDSRRDVFITPAVKCRTPGGRPPHAEESAACAAHLRRQYKAVKPKAVLALGDAACGALTGNAADFPSLVGQDWTWGAVPALVLWTPSEVLANPGRLRAPVWDALKRLKAAWNAAGTGV